MDQSIKGRRAKRPSAFPASAWKEILLRVVAEIGNDRVLLVAGGVTYYLLLAIIPGLSAVISVYGLVADPAAIQEYTAFLQQFLPGGGVEIINEQMTRLADQETTSLGLTFVISLGVALWSANAGMKSLFEAMNVAYDEQEKRSFIKLTAVSFIFTLAAILGLLLLLGLIVVVPILLDFVGVDDATGWLVQAASYAGVLVLAVAGTACLYCWGPSRARAKWRWITPGAAATTIVVIVVSILFSWYVSNFGSYNATYGSLGALIGFLTWIWLSVTILIVGAELNSEMEHQTIVDSTVAPDKPLGERGAVMADRVAGLDEDSVAGMAAAGRARPQRTRGQSLNAGHLALGASALVLLALLRRRTGRRH